MKAAKKTFQSLSVRSKLASLRSVFPHDDQTEVKNMAEIYREVLEYSRSVSSRISLPK
jgi:hypothetical protein